MDSDETGIMMKFVTYEKAMELTRNMGLRRLQWVSHVMRMKEERVPKRALLGSVEGRGPVGSPSRRWLDAVDRDVEMQELQMVGRGQKHGGIGMKR